ncbi:hypothetical protein BGZ80_007950 [Entomortierella chlamydospora]|uniref:Molybdopterin synthase sulfur carrier subunit n=1 Tax=Entomortierella chlamydospora TaxID=101097 RepID=A0A9P6T1I0_9FUNG|nr:hypothetical protein BGZ79_005329 [Entomortierella chlamydospora]KAG0017754.1 hypothetical protein BGZ80_007950 [Entomortierella chlamydospora]
MSHVSAALVILLIYFSVHRFVLTQGNFAQFTVLYFASAKDASKVDTDKFEWSAGINAQTLTNLLVERHPDLGYVLKTSMFAVNMEYMENDSSWTVQPGDEVAIIPPVSGG